MLDQNERLNEFFRKLAEKDVTYHWMWEARRDGQKPNCMRKTPLWPDIGMVAFTGLGFQPSVLVAIVIDYGKDGFGLFTDGGVNSIDHDVDRIARPRDTSKPHSSDMVAARQ